MNQTSEKVISDVIETYTRYPISITDVANMFNLCDVTVSRILKKYNVPIYTKQQLFDTSLNIDYFRVIDTEDKAYLLGFLLADGCIYHNSKANTYRICFQLNVTDKYIVDLFKQKTNTSSSILVDNRKHSSCCSCNITNNIMALDLMNHGMIIGKPNRTFPQVRNDLIHHLLRGIFDGDGCISYRKRTRKNSSTYRAKVDISGYYNILNPIKDIYDKIIGISKYTFRADSNSKILGYLDVYRTSDILLFYEYIYNKAHYYLKRKKQKFDEFFAYRNL